jgi:hypothetical protein
MQSVSAGRVSGTGVAFVPTGSGCRERARHQGGGNRDEIAMELVVISLQETASASRLQQTKAESN